MDGIVVIEGELPLEEEFELVGTASSQMGTCGGVGPDMVLLWTPPAPGEYLIYAAPTWGLDTVMYVRDATEGLCGAELGCKDDADPFDDEGSDLRLVLGTDPIAIIVDSKSPDAFGPFSLEMYALD